MFYQTGRNAFLNTLMCCPPQASAWIQGSSAYPQLHGVVNFYAVFPEGLLIEAEIFGMPNADTPGSSGFYGMHIHEYGDCSDDFAHTGMHYNPTNKPHPGHSGDLPPLPVSEGYAYLLFYTKKLELDEVIGKSLIIHSQRDDFTTQPSGDSGAKIGCGIIEGIA